MITKIYGRNLTGWSYTICQLAFGIAFAAMPLSAWAQDDADGEEEAAPKRTIVKKQKNYDTRTVSGKVVDAATRQGISGAIWPLFFTAFYYLVFNGILTVALSRVEKKLDYFR